MNVFAGTDILLPQDAMVNTATKARERQSNFLNFILYISFTICHNRLEVYHTFPLMSRFNWNLENFSLHAKKAAHKDSPFVIIND